MCKRPEESITVGRKTAPWNSCRLSRMRNISLRSYASSVYTTAALLVVGLRYTAVLSFACCWLAYTTCTAIIKFLLNSSIIFCRTLVGSLPLANNVQHSASKHVIFANCQTLAVRNFMTSTVQSCTVALYTFLRSVLISCPAMMAVPLVGVVSPINMLNVVVLPAPTQHTRQKMMSKAGTKVQRRCISVYI